MKKHWVLCEKTENWTGVLCTTQLVDRLGLPNDLVDRLIGETMKFAIVWFGQSNWSTVKDTNEISNNRSIDWLCQYKLVDHSN
jgi:hypothetical protein